MPLAGSGQIVVIKQDGTDGSNYCLLEGSIDIGSGKSCDIRVPKKGFPNRQCSITVLKNQATLKNCSVAAPTVVNNTPVNQKVLNHGDIITFPVDIGRFRWDYLNIKAFQKHISNKASNGDIMKPKLVKKARKSIGRRKSEGVIKKNDHKQVIDVKTRRSLDTLPGAYSPKTRQVAVVKPQRRDMGNLFPETSIVSSSPLANHSNARKSEGRSVGKGQSRISGSNDLVYYDSTKRRKTNEVEKLDTPVVLDKNKRAALMLLTARSPANRGSPKSPANKRSPKSPSAGITNENWPQMMAQNINFRESLAVDSNLSSKNPPRLVNSEVRYAKVQLEKWTPSSKNNVSSKILHTKDITTGSGVRGGRATPASVVSSKRTASAVKLTQTRTPAARPNPLVKSARLASPLVRLSISKTLQSKSMRPKIPAAKSASAGIGLQKSSMRCISKLPVKTVSNSKVTPMKSNLGKSVKAVSAKISTAKATSIKKVLNDASLVRSTPRRPHVASILEEKSPVKSSPRRTIPKKLSLEETLSPNVPNKTLSPLKKSSMKTSAKKIALKSAGRSSSNKNRSLSVDHTQVRPLKHISLEFINKVDKKSSTPKGSPKKFSFKPSPGAGVTSPVVEVLSSPDRPVLKRVSKTPSMTNSTPVKTLKMTPKSTPIMTSTHARKGTPEVNTTVMSIGKGTPEINQNLTPHISKVSVKTALSSSKQTSSAAGIHMRSSATPSVTSKASPKLSLTKSPKLTSKNKSKLSPLKIPKLMTPTSAKLTSSILRKTSPQSSSKVSFTPKSGLKSSLKSSSDDTPKVTSKNTPKSTPSKTPISAKFTSNVLRKTTPRSSSKMSFSPKSGLKSSLKTPTSIRKSAAKLKFKLTPRSIRKVASPKSLSDVSVTSSYLNLSGESSFSFNSIGESTLLYSTAESTLGRTNRRSRSSSRLQITIEDTIVESPKKPRTSGSSKSPPVESSSSSLLFTRTSRSNTATPASRKSVDFFTPKSEKKSSCKPSSTGLKMSEGDSSLISSIRTAFNVLNNSQLNLKSALKSPDSKPRKSGRKSATIKFDLSNVESPIAEVMEIGQPGFKSGKNDSVSKSARSSRSSLTEDMFDAFNYSEVSTNFDDDDDVRYSFNTSFKGNSSKSRTISDKSDMFADLKDSYVDSSTAQSNNSSPYTVSPIRKSGRKFLSESIKTLSPQSKQNSPKVQKQSSAKESSPKCNVLSLSPIVSPKLRSPRTPVVNSERNDINTTPNLSKLFDMKASTPIVGRKSSGRLMETKSTIASRRSHPAKIEKKSPTNNHPRKSSVDPPVKINLRKSLQGVVKKTVNIHKSKSMIGLAPRKSRHSNVSTDQLSNSSGGTDVNALGTDNEIVITPKTIMKLVPEMLKEKHSTAKKSKSRKNIIDHLTDLPDLAKELFASPVKRKLSQSMRQYNASFKSDDIEDASIRDASFELLNSAKKTGKLSKTPNTSIGLGSLKTPNVSTEIIVSPISNNSNKKVPSPKINSSSRKGRSSVKSTRISTSKIVKTSKVQKSPKNALVKFDGIKKLFSSARKQKSPKNDLLNIVSVKSFYNTPGKKAKSPKNDLSNVKGVKRLMKTPKNLKSPSNDLTNVTGVQSLFAQKTRSPRNDLTDVGGIKALLKTPRRVQKSPKNELVNISAVKTLFNSKGKQKSPRNDLTKVVGVKKVFSTPKLIRSPANNLSNISGVEKMFEISLASGKSPKPTGNLRKISCSTKVSSPMKAEKSASENMFDSLTGTTPVKTYSKVKISSVNSQRSPSNVTKSSEKKGRNKIYTDQSTVLAADSVDNSQSNRSRRQLTIDRTNFSFEVSKATAALRKSIKKGNEQTELSILGQSTPANKRKKPLVNESVINIRQLSPILSLAKSDKTKSPAGSPMIAKSLRGKRLSGKIVQQNPAKKKKVHASLKLSPVRVSPKQESPVKKGVTKKLAPKKVKKTVKVSPQSKSEAESKSKITRGSKSSPVTKVIKDTSPVRLSPVKEKKVTRSKKAVVRSVESVNVVEPEKRTRGRQALKSPTVEEQNTRAPTRKVARSADSKKKVTFAPDTAATVANINPVKSRSTRSNKVAVIEEITTVEVKQTTRGKTVVKKTNIKKSTTSKKKLTKSTKGSPISTSQDEIITTRKRKRGATDEEVVKPKMKKADLPKQVSPVKAVTKSLSAKKAPKKAPKKATTDTKSSPVKVTRSMRPRK